MDNLQSEFLEKIKADRNKKVSPKITEYSKPQDLMSSPLDHLSSLTQCCPEAREREVVPHETRKQTIVNDLVENLLLNYPEELRDSIREQVKSSMHF
jgi:hypothetical protein